MHGHAAAKEIGVLVIADEVWGTHPFVSCGDAAAVVGDVVAVFILNAQKAADVVENSDIIRPVNYERGFIVASRQVFCGVDEIVVGAGNRLGGEGRGKEE